jgi:thioesterase domain-containing protein/acyl carrier protein
VHGFRIELGEIECALLACPGVKHAAVRVWENDEGRKLGAYVVCDAQSADRVQALKQALRLKLPAWMVPADIVLLESLPVTASGKVDANALPPPVPAPGQSSERAPSVLEARIAVLMASVIGVQDIGLHEDFFNTGGTSLGAIRLLGRIERELGRRIVAADFLKCPTVEHIAQLVARAPATALPGEIELLRRGGAERTIFFGPDIFGSSFNARVYLPHLPPEASVYAMRLRQRQEDGSLEEVARRQVRAIRAIQRQGPYYLAGYSYGGHLAYESACQLLAMGETIGLLAIIDTTPGFDSVRTRVLNDLPEDSVPGIACHLLQHAYRQFPGKVLYFRSSARWEAAYLAPGGGWELLARGGVRSVRVPGSHDAVRREPVAATVGRVLWEAMCAPSGIEASAGPGAAEDWLLQAQPLVRAGDLRGQLELYRKRLARAPLPAPWVLVNFAELCAELGQPALLDGVLISIDSAPEDDARLAYAGGRICEECGYWQLSRQWFRKAASLERADPAPQMKLSYALREPAEKLAAVRAAAQLSPADPIVRLRLAECLLLSGERWKARDELRRVIELHPHDKATHSRAKDILGTTEPAPD